MVAVNVSAAQVNDAGFVAIVRDALAASGLPAERLKIEMTETAALSDKSKAARVLSGVRDLGVGITLDDFGTCYSSLSMVQKLPLTRLKPACTTNRPQLRSADRRHPEDDQYRARRP